jgi:hypothetical protein
MGGQWVVLQRACRVAPVRQRYRYQPGPTTEPADSRPPTCTCYGPPIKLSVTRNACRPGLPGQDGFPRVQVRARPKLGVRGLMTAGRKRWVAEA